MQLDRDFFLERMRQESLRGRKFRAAEAALMVDDRE